MAPQCPFLLRNNLLSTLSKKYFHKVSILFPNHSPLLPTYPIKKAAQTLVRAALYDVLPVLLFCVQQARVAET